MIRHYQVLSLALLVGATLCYAEQDVKLDGREIMEEMYRRHRQYPYVYEQQSMVMRDRDGKRDTRKAQRYSRVEKDGTAKFMLVFDYPIEIKGVAVLATRNPDGHLSSSVYLPAFAEKLIPSVGESGQSNFLGTDFSVESIVGEVLADYQYVRRHDRSINDMLFFVIDVYHRGENVEKAIPVRRHYVRQDNYFISHTEHYDNNGRLHKRQSFHDLRAVDGEMWRSGMILMEDVKEHHQSLLKVTRRKYSHDYVPAEMFSGEWLYENYPYVAPPEETGEEENGEGDAVFSELDEQLTQMPGKGVTEQ